MKRILLVEDDPELNRNISEALKSEKMFVESVYDGRVAEKLLARNNYDCIILDVNLPGTSGITLCKQFRTYNTETPVIFLTAFDQLEDKVEGFDAGADDYITKPFFIRELALRINNLIKRSKTNKFETEEKIISGNLVIDQKMKSVTKFGKTIELTPREFEILLLLVSNKGELISKQKLIEHIWGKSIDMNTNTIEVYINFLRKKIDKPFNENSIKTKIGFGYYFE